MRSLRAIFTLLALALSLHAGEPLVMVVHPASTAKSITKEEAGSLLRGNTLFLGGKRITLVLSKPSTRSLPAVSYGLTATSPAGLLGLIKQAKMRGVVYDPEFVDTADAVEARVASTPNAVGFLLASESKGAGVKVIPISE